MAFDNETRNRLKSFVGSARNLLAEEFTRQLQNTYGMNPATGEIDDLSRLTHLDPSAREIAQLLRTTVEHYRATSPATTTADLLDRLVREQAFTILNRLCALRLAEARGILIESIARGYQSKGFQLYARVANGALGDTAETYRAYLLSVFDELAVDLPVLFYRYSPQGRLFPRETALLALLELINHDDLAPLWAEDETIGWIYQYFNSVEERKKMRDESSAPRSSREMAVRNQFFTPRYVVEFLTDNTLGRTWYEMRKGQTGIVDQCRYFVRRPTEIFLKEGEEPPAESDQWSVTSGQNEVADHRPPTTDHQETSHGSQLSGASSLAGRDDSGGASIRSDQGIPEGGAIRTDEPGSPGGGIGAVEHRRGSGQELDEGVSESSVDRLRVTSGSGDPTGDRPQTSVPFAGSASATSGTHQQSGPNDQRSLRSPGEAPSNLTTDHRPLTTDHRPPTTDHLSQEELWQRPVYTLHRDQKDPRDLKVLDPAMGSGHFLLYAFDLLETIYREAWEQQWEVVGGQDSVISEEQVRKMLAEAGWPYNSDHRPPTTDHLSNDQPLIIAYPTREALRRAIPELILRHNLHGVDIDPRAVQIAGLALWLRAQKAWQAAGVKPAERPAIRKSNLVVAEPMPGEKDLLDDFLKDLKPALLGRLVRQVFDSMKLAGEAGTLLRVEDELQQEIEKARREWQALQKKAKAGERSTSVVDMFSGAAPEQLEIELREQELMQISSERFWKDTEERVLKLLRDYAEQAESGTGARRRLFADDAAKGFAFVDLCRTKFDVVVMNPPFGEASETVGAGMTFPLELTAGNLLCGFILRGCELLGPAGLVGSLTDRTWIQKVTYRGFRREILSSTSRIETLLDLGAEVLDGAQVEACAQVIRNSSVTNEALFLDLRVYAEQDRPPVLSQKLRSPIQRRLESFRRFPDEALSYWCPDGVARLFSRSTPLDPSLAGSKRGISAGDTTRAFRCEWEVSPSNRGQNKLWEPLQNGGEFSPFLRSTSYVALSQNDFEQLTPLTGSRIQNVASMRSLGITWGKRCEFASFSVMPRGHIFTDEGQAVIPDSAEMLWGILGYLNSRAYRFTLNLFCGQHKSNGYVGKLPLDRSIYDLGDPLISSTSENIFHILYSQPRSEPSWEFLSLIQNVCGCGNTPVTLSSGLSKLHVELLEADSKLLQLQEALDDQVYRICGLDVDDQTTIRHNTAGSRPPSASNLVLGETVESSFLLAGLASIIQETTGHSFGRWDIRYTTGEKEPPPLPDPFDPLPVCPPGMLQRPDGLPVEKQEELPDGYPIDIPWDGILVDDPGHGRDVIARLKRVFEVIWGEAADDRMREAAELLGQKDGDLRPWLRRDFFPFHLKRYSKSRRKAPIYWPLSTPSGAYTLWIYYHRLTDQTLLTAVNDFVEPKIDQVEGDIAKLRQNTDRTKKQEQELAALTDLEHELRDFREELLRIARFWKPNLNDGVQITAAPLWKLFQHKPWQTVLKDTWKKLEKGDYDWAHLAYSIWPDRVREKCKTDKSLAIAHGLESVYVEPPANAKKGKGRKKKVEVEMDEEEGEE